MGISARRSAPTLRAHCFVFVRRSRTGNTPGGPFRPDEWGRSCSGVVTVGRRVVDAIECRHPVDLDATELALENGDVVPRVVRLVSRRDTPEVVPFAAPRFR